MTVNIMELEWGRDINKNSSYLVIIEEKGHIILCILSVNRDFPWGLWDGSEIWNDNTIFDENSVTFFIHNTFILYTLQSYPN